MIWVARAFGTLFVVFGLLGLFAVWVGQDLGFPIPTWNGRAWSAALRRGADWAGYGGIALSGLLLIVRPALAPGLFGLVLAVAAAKTGYDLALGDPSTARQQTVLRGDFVLVASAAVGLLVALVVPRIARRRRSFGSADSG